MKTLNFCFIVCGPSGVGKTTLVRDLLQSPESQLSLSISYTTRAPRGAEQNGKDYFFVDDATALAEIYRQIEEELRSQYLIAYQSTNSGSGDDFRVVELQVDAPGAKAETIRGYYP